MFLEEHVEHKERKLPEANYCYNWTSFPSTFSPNHPFIAIMFILGTCLVLPLHNTCDNWESSYVHVRMYHVFCWLPKPLLGGTPFSYVFSCVSCAEQGLSLVTKRGLGSQAQPLQWPSRLKFTFRARAALHTKLPGCYWKVVRRSTAFCREAM